MAQDITLSLSTFGFDMDGQHNYMIVSDKQRIQQVVLNFVNNALKFTDSEGSITVICELISKFSTDEMRF